MSLFNLFKKKTTDVVEVLEEKEKATTSDVSKELFIEEVATGKEELFEAKNYNLDKIYAFASKDFEEKGYDDALVNPDYSYSNDNINLYS